MIQGGGQDNPAGLSSPPGGQDKPAGISYPPGVKISRVGGKISQDSLPPGGQAVQGGKINCYTGIPVYSTTGCGGAGGAGGGGGGGGRGGG